MSRAREILLEHGLFCPRGVKMSSGVYPLREFTQSSDTLKTIHIRLCESSQETLGAWTLLGKVWKFASVMGFDGFWWIFLAVGRITSQAAVTLNISVWKLKHTERVKSRAFPFSHPVSINPTNNSIQGLPGCVKVILTLWHVCGGGWKHCFAPHSLYTKQLLISKIQCL